MNEIERTTLPTPQQAPIPEALIETERFAEGETPHPRDLTNALQDDEQDVQPQQFGEYELLDELGRGGMGIVYRARQTKADRIVALKIIRPDQVSGLDPATRSEALRRFQVEARAAGRLEHDHLVTVYDVGNVEGHEYYSMRYVPGESLADRIAEAPLSGKETARLLEHVAAAIHHAHVHGVLHRDLKPHNILLDRESGRALVADFGLAKLIDTEAADQQTDTRGIIGTVAYMAPEQTRIPMQTSAATDVWALGAIIYCCITGRPPFRAKDYVATFRQIQESDPAAPRVVNPDVDRDIETISLKCLEKSPQRRYESAAALSEELGRYVRGEPILARPPGLAEKTWRWAKKHKGLVATAATILLLLAGSVWMAAQARKGGRADELAESLFIVEPRELPAVVASIQPVLARVEPKVRDALNSSGPNASQERQIRAALALLPSDPRQVVFVAGQLPTCDPELVLPIVGALGRHADGLTESYWQELLRKPEGPPSEWLRRSAALAHWDSESRHWGAVSRRLVATLVAQNSFDVANVWQNAFRPISDELLDDLLGRYDLSTVPEHRATAAQVIANWYATDAEALARFALLAEAAHYELIAGHLQDDGTRDTAATFLDQFIEREDLTLYQPQPADATMNGPSPPEESRARRVSNAVAVLCQLRNADEVLPFLRGSTNPQVRSFLIHRLTPQMLNPDDVVRQLKSAEDASIRRALLLLLGEYIPASDAGRFTDTIYNVFANGPDAGAHSAAEWCLRQWGHDERIDQFVASERANAPGYADPGGWYVNRQGHTMAVLSAGEFLMGSPPDEPGRRDWEQTPTPTKLEYSFSISTTEVTWKQFRRKFPNHPIDPRWTSTDDCPVSRASWLFAAAYCNWLSQEEGLPESEWCYPTTIDESLTLDPDYLTRRGYRLPTEQEWEYACRAGTVTSRYYGTSDDLLPQYAWFSQKPAVSQPVGRLKPNDFGLFDMYGNAWEWCNTFIQREPAPQGSATPEIITAFNHAPERSTLFDVPWVVRSETVEDEADNMRSAMRTFIHIPLGELLASNVSTGFGFRIARTETTAPLANDGGREE